MPIVNDRMKKPHTYTNAKEGYAPERMDALCGDESTAKPETKARPKASHRLPSAICSALW